MGNSCRQCGLYIPPPGTTYTGQVCMYGGNHPNINQPIVNAWASPELIKAIKDLTKAIEKLAPKGEQEQHKTIDKT